ncbi:glycosyltransferase family 2 protein, partial [bacterium]|nr:glycosyltransferase family 2 protein [bacterium]
MRESIYIIILNWNGGQDTLECLASLQNIDYDNYKIVLVDNGSTDGIVDIVKQKYPDIEVISNSGNFGFVEGNNIGIRYALKRKADYIFLLNNDTVVDKDVLKEMMKVIKSDETIGAVCPKILNYYSKEVIESAGGSFSINFSKNIAVGYGQRDIGQFDYDREVDFISGCAFFAKAEIFNQAGFFDKIYFAYYEDMDLC